MSERLKLVIDRERWGRGAWATALLRGRYSGLMCCLGFICEAAGLEAEHYTNRGMPNDLPSVIAGAIAQPWRNLILVDATVPDRKNTELAEVAARINDTRIGLAVYGQMPGLPEAAATGITITSEQHREELLTNLFAAHGVDVTFVDKREAVAA